MPSPIEALIRASPPPSFTSPMDYLAKRALAYQAGAAQGRSGNLFRSLGLWQAPQAPGLMQQDEPRLIAQERAQRQAAEAEERERQEQRAGEERAFGRNVFIERLRQGGREALLGERLEQQKETFEEREARLKTQHAATLAAKDAAAEARQAAAAQKRQEDYAKWLHGKPGQAATKAQARQWAMALPPPFRQAALARIDADEGAKELDRRRREERAVSAGDRLERDFDLRVEREARLAAEAKARGERAVARTAQEAEAVRMRDYTRLLNQLRQQTGIGESYEGATDEQLEDAALAILERVESRLAASQGVVR